MAGAGIHFLYEPGKEPGEGFARGLIKALGQTPLKKADKIVSIGGDGLLLRALRKASGHDVMGVIPPGSNSRGFWTNKGISTADDMVRLLEEGGKYEIMPLRADISFAGGSREVRYGYNDISVQSIAKPLPGYLRRQFELSAIDESVQSALLNLRIVFDQAVIGPCRIMGRGLVFATPFGSTAMSRNYNGPAVDIRNPSILLTGIGISEPTKGFSPVVNDSHTRFEVEVDSTNKRPVMVTFDSFGLSRNKERQEIRHVAISAAQEGVARLVLKDDPGTRAYSAMIPHN